MTFVIRPAEPSDWEAVRDIRLRSLREEPDAYASEYQTEARFEPDHVETATRHRVQLSGV